MSKTNFIVQLSDGSGPETIRASTVRRAAEDCVRGALFNGAIVDDDGTPVTVADPDGNIFQLRVSIDFTPTFMASEPVLVKAAVTAQ